MTHTLNKVFFGLFLMVGIFGFIPDLALPLKMSQEMCNERTLVLFIGVFFIKNVWLKLFYVWSLVCMIIQKPHYTKDAALVMNSIMIALVYYQIVKDKFKESWVDYILNTVCLMALLQIGLMTLQYFNIWTLYKPIGAIGVPCGFLGNTNISGSFLALSLPAFLYKKKLLPILFWGLFLSKCLGGIIPVVAGLVFYCFYRYGKKGFYCLGVIFVALLVYVGCCENYKPKTYGNIYSGSTRFFHYKVIFKDIICKNTKSFFMGYGLGTFKRCFPLYQNKSKMYEKVYPFKCAEVWKQAHNEYLQVMSEHGFIGLFFLLGYLIKLTIDYFRKRTYLTTLFFIGIIIVMINSGVHFLFHTTTAILAITYLAFFEILTNKGDDNEKNIMFA